MKPASGTGRWRSYSKLEQCLSIGSFRDGCRSGEKKQSWRLSQGNQYPRSGCRSVLSLQPKEEGLDEERVRTEPFRGKRRSSGAGDLFEDAPMEMAGCAVRLKGSW